MLDIHEGDELVIELEDGYMSVKKEEKKIGEVLKMASKPILFNTEMVRAILDGRKTQTRRLIKPQPTNPRWNNIGFLGWDDGHGYKLKQPYKQGDILWVRETWLKADDGFYYKADVKAPSESEDMRKAYGYKWKPSIHMPREAARIFLKVTNVRVERLHDITENDARNEGVKDPYDYQEPSYYNRPHVRGMEINKAAFAGLWDSIYATPKAVKNSDGEILYYESYPWEDIQETKEYKGKLGHVYGNPWVWIYEFERVSKDGSSKDE